jgi:hypothetical protein
MPTLNDICERAMRKIGVVAIDEAMDADQAKHAAETYNAMVSGWALKGVNAPVSPVSLTDAFPFPPRFEQAVTFILADTLAQDYERPGVSMAQQSMADITAYFHVVPRVRMPRALTRTPSQRWGNNAEG